MTQVMIRFREMGFLVDPDRKIITTFKPINFKEDIKIHL